MRTWINTLALILAGIVLLPAAAIADEKYIISAETWSYYQEYLGKIKNGLRPGAYVITKDGYSSYYYWCSETQCMPGATYSQDALNACEKEYNTDCVVFAVRDDIRVEYEIAGKETSAAPAPTLSPAPPVTKIKVSAEVKAEIDRYLQNAQRAGRVWALAIANDGSQIGVANCQSTGGGGYFGGGGAGCNLVSGGPQEQASREAIQRCGGPTACVLLYEGSTKSANINVYGPSEVPETGELGAVTPPALPAPPPATKIVVSADVKDEIEAYLRNARRTGRAWALAIANDGASIAFASCQNNAGYVESRECNMVLGSPQEMARRAAIARCGGPADCMLLYDGAQQKANVALIGPDGGAIKVATAETPTPESSAPKSSALASAAPAAPVAAAVEPKPAPSTAALELSAPPPATKIVVSPAVKAEIETYLGNTQSSGKAWALAVANDGSGVAFASCPTSGTYSGGRACEPIKGSPQELASREAIMRCGGAAACALLYEGAQPAGKIEIVTQ